MGVSITLDSANLSYGKYDNRHLTFKVEQTSPSKATWTLSVLGNEHDYYKTGPTTATIAGTKVYEAARVTNTSSAKFPNCVDKKTGTVNISTSTTSLKATFLTWVYWDTGNSQNALSGTLSIPKVRVRFKPNNGTHSVSSYTDDGTKYYVGTNSSGYMYQNTDNTTNTRYQNFYYNGSTKDPVNASSFKLVRTGYKFTGWKSNYDSSIKGQSTKYTAQDLHADVVNGDQTVTFTAQWERIIYTIDYDLKGGTTSSTLKETYSIASDDFTLPQPTKTGYTFAGWTGSNGTTAQKTVTVKKGSTGNKSYTANWTANTNTPYKVQHWQQTVTGGDTENSTNYTVADTQNLTGTTASSVSPSVKTYTGFTSPSKKTATIAANGSTVINYYYKRNSYTVSLTKGTGIATVSGAGTYKYKASVTINATMNTGYSWSKWTGDKASSTRNYTFDMPANNVSNTANATINSHQVSLTKGTGISSVSGAGTYNYNASVTINATPSAGYSWSKWTGDKASSTQNYNFNMPDNDVSNTANASIITYTIGYTLNGGSVATANPTSYNVTTATFTLNNPTKTGYTFVGWTGSGLSSASTSVSISKGSTGNKSYTANWTANTNTPYKVNHWQQNIDAPTTQNSTNYTLKDTQNLTGTTAAEVTPSRKSYTGFTAPSGKKITIAANGSSVVDYYYTRNSHTVTLTKGTGIATVSGAGTYHYKKSVTINATMNTGYSWSKWTGDKASSTRNYTFDMPANNVSNTANASPYTLTLIYNNNGGTQPSSNDKQMPYRSTQTYGNKYNNDNGLIDINTFEVTKAGYFAQKWNTATNGNGIMIEQNVSYKAEEIASLCGYNLGTGNVTINLYPYWEAKKLTVRFHKNDGSTLTADQVFVYGASGNRFGYNTNGTAKWPPTAGTYADLYGFGKWYREGYKILGWAESADATSAKYSTYSSVNDLWIEGKMTGNIDKKTIDLYAVWTYNGTIRICEEDNKDFQLAIPYIYDGTSWKCAIGYIYNSGWNVGI